MIKEETVNGIWEAVRKTLARSRGSHDWDHTERVYNLCLHIGRAEGADLDVLRLAALLHDIGREHQDRSGGTVCHAEKGALIARRLLARFKISTRTMARVLHCVRSHRFRGSTMPESLEAKILFDADKIDSIGAVGIGRAFLFAGEVGAILHNKQVDEERTRAYSRQDTAYREYRVKLRRIRDRMLTGEGKRMAVGRHRFMAAFFKQLNNEVDGLR